MDISSYKDYYPKLTTKRSLPLFGYTEPSALLHQLAKWVAKMKVVVCEGISISISIHSPHPPIHKKELTGHRFAKIQVTIAVCLRPASEKWR